MNDYSYISTAVQAISGYKTRDGLIASYALHILGDDTNEVTSLLNAIAVAHDRTIIQDTQHRFNGGKAPVAAPIAFLDHVQTIMNKSVSLARHDIRGKRTADFGNGIDFSQDHTDLIGFNVDTSHVPDLINEDFRVLLILHTYIAQGMEYLTDIEPLHYHSESIKLDEIWIKDNVADSFDEACSILDKKGEEYRLERAAVRQGESATIDFTAKLKDTPDQKRATLGLALNEAQFDKDLKERKAKAKANGITDGAVDSIVTKRKTVTA